MALSLDHIIISVQDLQTAIKTYQDAGFTVNYGGQHGDGFTENGLIVLSDGSYIELIALVEGKSYADAGFKPLLKETGEGFTGFALVSDDIESDVAAMRERGIEVGEITQGSRVRSDGETLAWKSAKIDNAMSPFVIQDLTDRELRVPLTTENITHENGATGIHELLIHVPSFDDAKDHFGNIVGVPLILNGVARYEIGSSALVIMGVSGGQSIPQLLSLYTNETSPTPYQFHGADFMFI